MPNLSILIPHYNTPSATRALVVCLKCIAENTPIDYELIVTAHKEREFPAWNRMAEMASSEWLVFINSDQFVAPGWAEALLGARDGEDTIVLAAVTESGRVEVSEQMLTADFGNTPETFDRAGFEAYASGKPVAPDRFAWSYPYLVNRHAFLARGGFSITNMERMENDLLFMRHWIDVGARQVHADSYVYHLGRWTITGASRP